MSARVGGPRRGASERLDQGRGGRRRRPPRRLAGGDGHAARRVGRRRQDPRGELDRARTAARGPASSGPARPALGAAPGPAAPRERAPRPSVAPPGAAGPPRARRAPASGPPSRPPARRRREPGRSAEAHRGRDGAHRQQAGALAGAAHDAVSGSAHRALIAGPRRAAGPGASLQAGPAPVALVGPGALGPRRRRRLRRRRRRGEIRRRLGSLPEAGLGRRPLCDRAVHGCPPGREADAGHASRGPRTARPGPCPSGRTGTTVMSLWARGARMRPGTVLPPLARAPADRGRQAGPGPGGRSLRRPA